MRRTKIASGHDAARDEAAVQRDRRARRRGAKCMLASRAVRCTVLRRAVGGARELCPHQPMRGPRDATLVVAENHHNASIVQRHWNSIGATSQLHLCVNRPLGLDGAAESCPLARERFRLAMRRDSRLAARALDARELVITDCAGNFVGDRGVSSACFPASLDQEHLSP